MPENVNDILERELVEAVGPEAAQRALAEEATSPPPQRQTLLGAAWSSRLLIGLLLVVALVVGAFLSVLSGSWWLMAGALAVHFLGTAIVLVFVFRLLSDVEAPSPTASAALEARGVRDPEGELNRLIERAEGDERGSVRRLFAGDEIYSGRSDPDDDRSRAVRRQQAAWTPGERSRPVDRGDAR
jgi:membrane protein implicated in regulation of membrane protease activity